MPEHTAILADPICKVYDNRTLEIPVGYRNRPRFLQYGTNLSHAESIISKSPDLRRK